MAEVLVDGPIRKVYKDGNVVISNVRNKWTLATTQYQVVSTWFDGSPMDDSKVDEWGVYSKFKDTGEYVKEIKNNAGELFLEIETVESLRALSPYYRFLITCGHFKGVRLCGYYIKGDTPGAVDYYIADPALSVVDDGGSVFIIDELKLKHDFCGYIDLSYFGLSRDAAFVLNHDVANKAARYSSMNTAMPLKSPTGWYYFSQTVNIFYNNASLYADDTPNTTWWYGGSETFLNVENEDPKKALQNIKMRKIRFRDSNGLGKICLSLNKVRDSIFDDIEIWGSTDNKGWKTAGLYTKGEQLDGSWNVRFKNLRCNNMEGMAHLLRTSQNNAVYFLNASTANCGIVTGYMIWLCGGNGISYVDSHFENFKTAVRISPYEASFNLRSVTFNGCYFESNADNPEERCIYITNKDKDGIARTINFSGFMIYGGYWNGHGANHAIEIAVDSGNVVTGSIRDVHYRNCGISFLKSSTAGERIKIEGRKYDNIPLLFNGGTSLCYVVENENGRDIISALNRYILPEKPNNFYNIEKQAAFLRLTISQTLPANAIKTTVSAQPSSAGNIVLTLPLLDDLAFENEYFIIKGSDDANTITVMPAPGNQFNLPIPGNRDWNILKKFNQYIHVIRDTTAGWRIVDSGILNRDRFITNRGAPNGVRTANSGAVYFQTDTSDKVVGVWFKTLTDGDNMNWISLSPSLATTSVAGIVKQAVAVPDGSTVDTLLQALRDAGLIAL